MNLNLTPERLKWATIAWHNSLAEKATEAQSVQEYIETLLQPEFDARANAISDSWKPVDAPDIAIKRDEISYKISTAPADKIEAIQAVIAAIIDEPTKETASESPVAEKVN